MTTTSETAPDEKLARPTWRAGLGVATAAAVAAGAVWTIRTQAAGIDLEAKAGNGTQTVGLASVLVMALLISTAGAATLRWWTRRSPRGRRRWTILAIAVTVVSMLSPLGALTPEAGLGLASLHLCVAGIVVGGLRKVSR